MSRVCVRSARLPNWGFPNDAAMSLRVPPNYYAYTYADYGGGGNRYFGPGEYVNLADYGWGWTVSAIYVVRYRDPDGPIGHNDNVHVSVTDANTGAVYGTADVDCTTVGNNGQTSTGENEDGKVAWIRRTFELPNSDANFTVRIEGVATNVNDCDAAHSSYLFLDSLAVDNQAPLPPPPPAVLEPPAIPDPIVLSRSFALAPALFATPLEEGKHVVLDDTMLLNMYGTVEVVAGVLFSFDGKPGVSSVVAAPLNAPIMRGEMSVAVAASFLTDAGAVFSDDKYRHLYAPSERSAAVSACCARSRLR
jgi:hypothetical protein